MTTRNPLVRVAGKIVDLPSGDDIWGAPQGSSATITIGTVSTGAAGSSATVTNSGTSGAAIFDFSIPQGNAGANGTGSGANFICNGRLTLTTGTAVTTSDVTGATTVYFTPFRGNQISTYDSSTWTGHTFTEISLALGTLTSGKNYDVFAYYSAGLILELSAAWSSDTARTDALALQDGVYVKSADHSRRYLGTIRTTSTTATEDSAAKRFVWNCYNRAQRPMQVLEATNTWNYSTATVRQANASTANQLDFVAGLAEDAVQATISAMVSNSSATPRAVSIGVGVDSATSITACSVRSATPASSGVAGMLQVTYNGIPGIGRHYLAWLEVGNGSDTQTWYGDNGGATFIQSGITGFAWA